MGATGLIAGTGSVEGPPRKVYTVNTRGGEYLTEFWGTWTFLSECITQLQQHIEHSQDEGK